MNTPMLALVIGAVVYSTTCLYLARRISRAAGYPPGSPEARILKGTNHE